VKRSANARAGYIIVVVLPVGSRNFKMLWNKIPSFGWMSGRCGCKNIGNFISKPKNSNTKRLAGVFCLKIPITDMDYVGLV